MSYTVDMSYIVSTDTLIAIADTILEHSGAQQNECVDMKHIVVSRTIH